MTAKTTPLLCQCFQRRLQLSKSNNSILLSSVTLKMMDSPQNLAPLKDSFSCHLPCHCYGHQGSKGGFSQCTLNELNYFGICNLSGLKHYQFHFWSSLALLRASDSTPKAATWSGFRYVELNPTLTLISQLSLLNYAASSQAVKYY